MSSPRYQEHVAFLRWRKRKQEEAAEKAQQKGSKRSR